MHLHDDIEIVEGHLGERLVAEDASVIDEDVDLAERVDGGLDHVGGAHPVGDAVIVGDGLAAGLFDLVDDGVGRRVGAALAVGRDAGIIDDDLGAARGQ